MELTKKKIAIIVAAIVAGCLIIAGIVVGIIFATKKTKHATTISSASNTTTLSFSTDFTTVTPEIYYDETLIIAFNNGFQNNTNKSFADLQNSLNALIDNLKFDGNLNIRVLSYTDKVGNISDKFNNPESAKNQIAQILANPEDITAKNPSQTNAITAIQSINLSSQIYRFIIPNSAAAAPLTEIKYCFYSPPKEAYFNSESIPQDSKQVGEKIQNIISNSNFALVLMGDIPIADYNITANQHFIDTTSNNISVAAKFLDPDLVTKTTPYVNATVFSIIVGGPTTTTPLITTATIIVTNSTIAESKTTSK